MRSRLNWSIKEYKDLIYSIPIIVYLGTGIIFMLNVAIVLLSRSRYAQSFFYIMMISIGLVLPTIIIKLKWKRIRHAIDKFNKKKKPFIISFLAVIILLIVWSSLSAALIVYIETEYYITKDNYIKLFQKVKDEKGILNATWDITENLKRDYISTYGHRVLIPSRQSNDFYREAFMIAYALYVHLLGGNKKIVVIQRLGGCGDFALAVAVLLSDISGLPTRIVYIEEIDHAFPEVYINGEWWVFDASYTTRRYPVKAVSYATYLNINRGELDRYVSRIIDYKKGDNLLKEHGFNSSILTITVIIDPTANPLDDVPASNIKVDIFSLENLYDPLVASNFTDSQGLYTVELNGNKEYIIVVRYPDNNPILVGIAKVYLPANSSITLEVRLHRYT